MRSSCFLLTTLFFLSFASLTRAQTNVYVPFPTSNAQWNQNQFTNGVFVGGGYSDAYYGYYYRISHDSIINSLTYHLINFAPRWDTSYYNPGINGGSPSSGSYNYPDDSIGILVGAIREDSMHRVYYRNLNNSFNNYCAIFPFDSDLLIYDFSLKPGDSSSISMYQVGKVTVTGYDSILVDSTYRKALLVSPFAGDTQVWCEGIGDTALGLLGTQSIPLTYPGSCITYLDCFWYKGQNLFDIRSGSCNSLVTSSINTLPSPKTSFQIFPNPASDELFLKFSPNFIPKEISVYNSIGQKINLPFNTSINKSLNVENLPAGLYIIKASDDENVLTEVFIKE